MVISNILHRGPKIKMRQPKGLMKYLNNFNLTVVDNKFQIICIFVHKIKKSIRIT